MCQFSIIIPTFNSENFLDAAIQSIFRQTFASWEILIVDGASTDNTVLKATKFKDLYSNIRIISEKDNGIYDAMNKGIQNAHGEWLYFLGSDDELFSSDTLQKVFDQQKEKDIDVIYGDVTSTRFGGVYGGAFDAEKIYKQNICHQGIFFKKRVFEIVGLFNLTYKSHADWAHNMQWLLDKRIQKKYIPLTVARYADGGYSSTFADDIFARDKPIHYWNQAKGQLNLEARRSIYLTLHLAYKKRGNSLQSTFYRLKYWFLKLC